MTNSVNGIDLKRQVRKSGNFFPELLRYCENGCRNLRHTCQRFTSSVRELTGFNPLVESMTLLGFVNTVYRANFMPKDSIQYFLYRDRSHFCSYSFESLEWLFLLAKRKMVFVRHAENDPKDEKRIFRYSSDGFIKETNTVLEYHGCFYHGWERLDFSAVFTLLFRS